jgi:hypothetical protein
LRVLEGHHGRCLDTEAEREIVAEALLAMFRDRWSADPAARD